MKLEAHIKPELWSAIAHSYESENYTHAIRDAMLVITEVLRDKSGLDGDGINLVGGALGFGSENQPRVKINKLQTQTERDMQKGLMFTLKGMYSLVRNPRTHERVPDTKETADAIILFIDYLLDYLGSSHQSFTVQDFLNKVTDPHFVLDHEYVENLVDTIPARKKSDTLITLYRQLDWRQSNNFEMVIKEILHRLTDEEISDFMVVVSEDIQTVTRSGGISLTIKILPAELWPKIQRMPRLRAENMLLEELREAYYIPQSDKTNKSAATWINRIAPYLLRKRQWRRVIISKLQQQDFDSHNFVGRYLLSALPDIFVENTEIRQCVNALADTLRAGNEFMKDSLMEYLNSYFEPQKWQDQFVESLHDLTDPDNPETYLNDGTPFLGKFEAQHNPEFGPEEIPF